MRNMENCKGCAAVYPINGKLECCNLVYWPAGVPENPPCRENPSEPETPEDIAFIKSWRVILKARNGFVPEGRDKYTP